MNTHTAAWNDVHQNVARREQEARRIAALDGHEIHSHSADWTFFTLDDDLQDDKANAVWRTCFSWNEFRFEGFVSDVSKRDR